jgi:cytochrome P450
MTFIGGQRACIGFKFAVLEMKALLFHLIRAFEFELAVDPRDVVSRER